MNSGLVKAFSLVLHCLGGFLVGVGLSTEAVAAGSAPPLANRALAAEEVHFLECLAFVYSPPLWISYENPDLPFYASDFLDLRSLAARLAGHTDPVSSYLWSQCTNAVRAALANGPRLEAEAPVVAEALAAEFNRIARGPSLYDLQRFKAVALRPETEGLLTGPLLADDRRRLNRLLLEDAYPRQIVKLRSLFFYPKDAEQDARLQKMVEERAAYEAFTNRQARFVLAAKVMAQSGIDPLWQRQLLLPYSMTNANLTPTLDKPLVLAARYQVVSPQAEGILNAAAKFRKGDVLLRVGDAILFVSGFGRVASDGSGTNAWLIEEGRLDFAVAPPILSRSNIVNAADLPAGRFRSFRAFSSVSLSAEEQNVLAQVSDAFRKEARTLAGALNQIAAAEKAREEFETYLSMATDSNPSIQFLVAKCYLEGHGTAKDEKRGLDWMRKASDNGSGEAQDYLNNLARQSK